MRVRMLVFVMVLILGKALAAQNFIEFQNYNYINPQVNVYMSGDFRSYKKFGWSAWGIVSHSWGEFYVGPTWHPNASSAFSVSFGTERAKHPWRVGMSQWMSSGKISFFAAEEKGGGGVWGRGTLTYTVSKVFETGLWAQAARGLGPYAGVRIKNYEIYLAPLFRRHAHTILVGVRYRFKWPI